MLKRTLLMLVLAVAFGLAMMPGEGWAQHPDLWVTFNVDWDPEVNPYDMNVRLTLADEFDGPIIGFGNLALTPNAGFTEWTAHYNNVPDDAVRYKITWDDGNPGATWFFDPDFPRIGNIDWENEEIIDGTAAFPDE